MLARPPRLISRVAIVDTNLGSEAREALFCRVFELTTMTGNWRLGASFGSRVTRCVKDRDDVDNVIERKHR